MGILFWPSASYKEILRTTKTGTFTIALHTPTGYIVDWGDGSVENYGLVLSSITHTYTAGIKVISLRAGFKDVTGINAAAMGIISATLRPLSNISNTLAFNDNPDLAVIELPITNNNFNNINFSNVLAFTGILDFRSMPNVGGTVLFSGMIGLKGLLFGETAPTALALRELRSIGTDITGILNLAPLKNLGHPNGGDIRFSNNKKLTNVLFPNVTDIITVLLFDGCNVTGVLNASMLLGLRGAVYIFNNLLLTGFLFPQTSAVFSNFFAYGCGFVNYDLSGYANQFTNFQIHNNTQLVSLLFHPDSRVTGQFYANGCKLNQPFPLGTVIRATDIRLHANGMSQANVNATIDNLYQNRANFATTAKTLQIQGTNAAPSGTALTQIADLRANYNWTITHS